MKNKLLSGIIGLTVADALGVPVEFKTRSYLRRNPVTDMIGYGTYNQPPGTWSDDTDTVAAVAGGLAGLFYGYENIPKEWINNIAKLDFIKQLCYKLH